MGIRLDHRPAAARFVTAGAGIESRHAFSYGQHYDAANTGFGLLVAHNDELLAPGAGYEQHRHTAVEILSWVVSGALRHDDDLGSTTVITPGTVQLLSAGTGVRHAERNAAATNTRYVQMWIEPAIDGPPSYATADLAGTGFVTLASGRSSEGLALRAPASFAVARLRAGEVASLDGSAFVHLSVVQGDVEVTVEGQTLTMADGDTARITGAGRLGIRAGRAAEVLGWVMDSAPGTPQ